MHTTNPKVDFFFAEAHKWQAEIKQLRTIALSLELKEVLKWGSPCYVSEDRNIVLIHTFKEYCAFLFFKGALLNDTHNILIQQTANVQAARQVRFTNLDEIIKQETTLKAYISQAIAVEKAGLKIAYKAKSELILPVELELVFAENPTYQTAFEALTPGRQRAYVLYFASPKQTKTRETRIAKCMDQILAGKGLNE